MTTFYECDVKDKISAFFVKLVETRQRRLVCGECGEDVALDQAGAGEVVADRQPVAPPAHRPTAAQAEAMLAALKKKMRDQGK